MPLPPKYPHRFTCPQCNWKGPVQKSDVLLGPFECPVILPFLMDRISRIKCSSMAAYHRWLDEAFHDYRTTTNGWHNPEYHLSC